MTRSERVYYFAAVATVCAWFFFFVRSLYMDDLLLAVFWLVMACWVANSCYRLKQWAMAERHPSLDMAFDWGFDDWERGQESVFGMTFRQNPFPAWTRQGRAWEDGRNFAMELDAEEEPLKADYPCVLPEKPIDFYGNYRCSCEACVDR